MKSTQDLLNDYYQFLSSSYQINKLDDSDEIVTPLTDNIGDNITIYLTRLDNGKIKLDDDGYTIDNLQMMNVNISEVRQQILDNICDQYSVNLTNGILSKTGTETDFSRMKLDLTSAMLKIGDLSFTQHSRVKKMFVEDVVSTFDKKELGGIKSEFTGRSGVTYKFPYVVPHRASHPLKIVDVMNHITTGKMMQSAFQFTDIENNAGFKYVLQPKFLLVYNDKANTPNSQSLKIAEDTGIHMYPFSALDSIESELTAQQKPVEIDRFKNSFKRTYVC